MNGLGPTTAPKIEKKLVWVLAKMADFALKHERQRSDDRADVLTSAQLSFEGFLDSTPKRSIRLSEAARHSILTVAENTKQRLREMKTRRSLRHVRQLRLF